MRVAEISRIRCSKASAIESLSIMVADSHRRKHIGVVSAASLILGSVIGSGIFVSPKGVYEETGSVSLSLIVWFVCGLISLLGALCYVELGTTICDSGGEYTYLYTAFGPFYAFLVLWTNIVAVQPCAQTILALTFGEYIVKVFFATCPVPQLPVFLLAVVSIVFLTLLNCYSNSISLKLQVLSTVAKTAALLLIASFGIWELIRGRCFETFDNPLKADVTVAKMSFAFYSGLFSYSGWNILNMVTNEVKNPNRTLLLAIWIAIPIITLLYMLVNVAYFTVIPPGEMLSTPATALTFGNKMFHSLASITPIFVALSTLGGINATIFSSGRLYHMGANNGHLPLVLSYVDPVTHIPRLAILISSVLSLAMLLVRDIYTLINYLSFVVWLFIGLSVIGMVYLRWKEPALVRPIRMNLLVPITFICVCCFLVLVPVVTRPLDAGFGLLVMLSGVPVYAILNSPKVKLPSPLSKMGNKFVLMLQKFLIIAEMEKGATE